MERANVPATSFPRKRLNSGPEAFPHKFARKNTDRILSALQSPASIDQPPESVRGSVDSSKEISRAAASSHPPPLSSRSGRAKTTNGSRTAKSPFSSSPPHKGTPHELRRPTRPLRSLVDEIRKRPTGPRLRSIGSNVSARLATAPEDEYESEIVDMLDVVDPEVSTMTTLTNAQNSLFIPDLGRFLSGRPSPGRPSTSSSVRGHARKHSSVFGISKPKARRELEPIKITEEDSKSKPKRKNNKASIGDTVLLNYLDPNRPDIAQEVGLKVLNSASQSEAEDEEESESSVPRLYPSSGAQTPITRPKLAKISYTISQDHTAGDVARRSNLLAAFGKKNAKKTRELQKEHVEKWKWTWEKKANSF